MELFLLHQFTFVGAPHIWNGDEMGMTGADDPDSRKPLTWPDINFEPETQSSFSSYTYTETPKFDQSMHDYYKSLIKLRKSSPAFTYGEYRLIDVADGRNVFAYYRTDGKDRFLVLFNNNPESNSIKLPDDISKYTMVFGYPESNQIELSPSMILKAYTGLVLKVKP